MEKVRMESGIPLLKPVINDLIFLAEKFKIKPPVSIKGD